jgi:DNA helicase-2/ATP-dependent DNA helicase PcrA
VVIEAADEVEVRTAGLAGEPVSARRIRSEPPPLDQLPVWDELVRWTDEADGDGPAVERLLAGLNPEQRRAVTHGEGPLLIVAGAGTGKTQVITRRIAWLIATKRARPSEILALTFTDKAAEEMETRVDELVPYGFTDTAISTFHAFGDRLIREYALELGLPTNVRVLSRPEVVIFLREHLFEFELDRYRPLGDPTRFLAALATLFSRCKDEDVSPAAYLAYAEGLLAAARSARPAGEGSGLPAAVEAAAVGVGAAVAADGAGAATDGVGAADAADAAARLEEAERQLELARAYVRYQELLAANGFIDFGDQVGLALRLLRESPAVRSAVQRRFRYVLVDEFQDTNRAQAELVALIAEPHRNVTVVGDDDQSIYKFRGAAISNILDFQQRYRGARTIVLVRNYRSRAPILEAAYRCIRHNDPDRLEVRAGIAKRLRSERPREGAAPVRVEGFATGSDEADWVAAEIGRRIAAGARPRDHAVLVRANAHADPIIRSLNVAGIPWRFSGTSGLYARPEVRLLLAFLRSVADPDSSVDLFALAASEVYGLGGEDLAVLANAARRRNRSLWETVGEAAAEPGFLRLSDDGRRRLGRLVEDLRRYLELAAQRPAGEVLYAFLKESGLLARYAAAETALAEEVLGNVARFFDIVRAQSALLADDRAIFVARHLETLIEAGDDPATADLDPDADAVAILTVHKAKGLEFPTVFMVGLVEGRFPAVERPEPLALPLALVRETLPSGDFRIQEERRLFCVGMTRARDELILTWAADYGGRTRRVSPFVLEALDLPPAARPAGSEGAATSALEKLAGFRTPDRPAEPERTRPEGPLTLSFYAIDDYLSCPLKYKYAHILRVPLAPHHAIVYGAALHAAVSEFHRRQLRGEIMTEAELIGAFEAAWTSEGFISRAHEEARLEAGRAALRRFLADQTRPGAAKPAWVERDFAFVLDGDRIRGRWDRVDIEPLAADGADRNGDGAGGVGGAAGVEVLDGPAGSDVVQRHLPLGLAERVTITDYKSSDVRDPAKARQRARESLQLQIYALAYEALTGRLPDAVALYFLDTGVVGRVGVEPKRLARARERIRTAAAGIRAGEFEARPDPVVCGYCPYRAICPSSAAR